MNKKDLLNTTIENVIYTIDNLFKGKNPSQELLNYLYLIATGMILEYEDDTIPAIYHTISTIKYINEPYYQKENSFFYQNPSNHNYRNKIIELTDFNDINLNYELQFKKIDSSPIKTLEYLTHEINYILFAKKRISLSDSLKVRFNYLTNHSPLLNIKEDPQSTINKIWGILQTEEIIKTILSLSTKPIKNVKFNKALNMFKDQNYDTYKVEGLDILVNLLRPLYKKETKRMINSFAVSSFEKEFDTILGQNSYKKLCQKIESLTNLISNSNNNNNYYLLSCEYVTLRNDFINKYINVKYA